MFFQPMRLVAFSVFALAACDGAAPSPPAAQVNRASGDVQTSFPPSSMLPIASSSTYPSSSVLPSSSPSASDPWALILNSPEYVACRNAGLVFDRAAKQCHSARVATYACTQEGIIQAFVAKQHANSAIADSYAQMIGVAGTVLDQCGEASNGDPIVFFYKKTDVGACGAQPAPCLALTRICASTTPGCQ